MALEAPRRSEREDSRESVAQNEPKSRWIRQYDAENAKAAKGAKGNEEWIAQNEPNFWCVSGDRSRKRRQGRVEVEAQYEANLKWGEFRAARFEREKSKLQKIFGG